MRNLFPLPATSYAGKHLELESVDEIKRCEGLFGDYKVASCRTRLLPWFG